MRNSSYVIRNYRPGDFNNFFQLHSESEQFDRSGRYITPEILAESLYRPHYSPAKDLFLAEMDGEIVGFCNLTPELRIGRVLFDILVHPKHRRAGIATELFQYAVKRAKEYGARVAQAEVPNTNLAGKGLLTSLGFRSVRRFYEMRLELNDFNRPEEEYTLGSRCLKSGDETKLTQIQNRSFSGTWGFNPNTTEEIVYSLNRRGCSPGDVILLLNGDEVISYCWTTVNSEENLALGTSKGRIHMMGVDPDFRGKGIGKAVLFAGLSYLNDKGIKTAELTVDSENKTACAIYESVGFKVHSSIVWYEKALI